MSKYIKVMFGTTPGANKQFEYKINEVNIAKNWNPTTIKGRDFGGFNFSKEDKIIRWLHRGDTLYDVEIPKDAEVVDVIESATPHGVLRTNKIILSNPRKVTDEMALEFYKKSTIPEIAYYKALAAVSVMNYQKTSLTILKDKVNKDNIDIVLEEWNDFIDNKDRKNSNETVKLIDELLHEIKSNLLISINIDKEPYIKKLTDDKIINLTGQSGSGKSYYAKEKYNSDDYLIIDTDEIFSDKRFENTNGINKELGLMFRNKYQKLPNLTEDFDLIYKEILEYCKNIDKIVVIDSAQFHCIKEISLLKGTLIVMRTSINNCYKRCIERYKNNTPNATKEELEKYKEKKKTIYKWYKHTNEFLEKIDKC